MARHWEDREYLKAGIGKQGMVGHVLWFLGLLFALLGIITDGANISLGLSATSWFLLAIVIMLASITFFMGWMVSWYLVTIDRKKERVCSRPLTRRRSASGGVPEAAFRAGA